MNISDIKVVSAKEDDKVIMEYLIESKIKFFGFKKNTPGICCSGETEEIVRTKIDKYYIKYGEGFKNII